MHVLSYSDAMCCALLLCSASHCLTVPCCCLVVGLPCGGVMSCRNRAVSRPRRVEIVPFRGRVVSRLNRAVSRPRRVDVRHVESCKP